MTGYSLRRRLLIWLLASTALLGVVALADTWREALLTAQGVSDRVLAGSAMAIAERVSVDEDGGLEVDIPYSALEMLASTAQDQVFYRVDGPPGTFITGYERLDVVPLQGDGIAFADATFGDAQIRVATLHRRASTGFAAIPFTVTVAESVLARQALARAILWRSALRLAGLILGAAIIVWVAVTLAMRPLHRLARAIAERSPDDLRPVREATPAEVEGIVEAVNAVMARLDTALGALRNFTGNASHQLRTPLAVVRTQLTLMTRANDPAMARTAGEKADAALARAERILAQLLMMARVDVAEGRLQPDLQDVAALARDLTAEMVPVAAAAGIDLGYAGVDRALIRAEPVLLAEMLRNLLDNALAYAGRGAEVTVRVTVGDSVKVTVEDNGPGIPADRRAALLTRRAAQSDTVGTEGGGAGGFGIGLTIVAEIARLFGGKLTLKDGADGRGLTAELAFPGM